MKRAFVAMLLVLAGPPRAADAQALDDQPVAHGPFQPEVRSRVREFVLTLASNFGGFYPQAQFRTVRAVYFASGAIIVCGELDKPTETGQRSGWRYFSNSGPLIFESDHTELLCDQRTYPQPAFADDYDYGPDFTRAAGGGALRTPTAEE
jgi:hypothetical protein